MKIKIIIFTLLAVLLAMASAQASEFDGLFVGGKIGLNRSDISGPLAAGGKGGTTWGIEEGYNWDMQRYLLGADFYVDVNSKENHAATINYGSAVIGVGLKLGLPNGSWMPYGHLGYARTKGSDFAYPISGGGLRGGLGIEYKYTSNWGVNAEWSGSSAKVNGSQLNNDNLTVGIKYYFGVPKEPPAPVPQPVAVKEAPMAEPVAAPAPPPAPAPVAAPAPAPAPQPRESWKIIKEQTPVTIEGANFDIDSAKLRPAAAAKLQPVVEFAKKYPDAGMKVHGHTSNTGTHAHNQKLSERRAEAVKAYLVKQGIDASRITTKGFGETEPIADNKTKEGRAENRRVEIHYTVIDERKVRVTK